MQGHTYSIHEQKKSGTLISSKTKTSPWGQKLGRGGNSISDSWLPPTEMGVSKGSVGTRPKVGDKRSQEVTNTIFLPRCLRTSQTKNMVYIR